MQVWSADGIPRIRGGSPGSTSGRPEFELKIPAGRAGLFREQVVRFFPNHRQPHAAAHLLAARHRVVAVLERANDKHIRIVPALAQGGVGKDEAHLFLQAGKVSGKRVQVIALAEDLTHPLDPGALHHIELHYRFRAAC